MRLVIVTGMSGAGRTTALKVLEDAGYFCVDNLPVPFIDKFAELTASGNSEITKVAIGIDIRSGKSLGQLEQVLEIGGKAEPQLRHRRMPCTTSSRGCSGSGRPQ